MNNETIFKKCDSKILLQTKSELDLTIEKVEEQKNTHEELGGDSVVEAVATELNLTEQLVAGENSLVTDNDIGSAESTPTIPNKLFTGTKNVLKIIGWINEKIGKSNASNPNISEESAIENRDEYSQGTQCF